MVRMQANLSGPPEMTTGEVSVRVPLRLSFVGGGTDLPEYYRVHGSHLIAAAVDWHVTVRRDPSGSRGEAPSEYVDRFFAAHGMVGTGRAESGVAPGSGLGGSGAVCVALAALRQLDNGSRLDPMSVAREAFRWERGPLGEPVGFQDHVVAAFGGCIEASATPDGVLAVQSRPDLAEAIQAMLGDGRLLISRLGGTRRSSGLLQEMASSFQSEQVDTRAKPGVTELESALLADDVETLGSLIERQWEWKVAATPGAAPPKIRDTLQALRAAGAAGGKVMGAGSCGMALVTSALRHREAVWYALNDFGCPPESVSLCHRGIHFPSTSPCREDMP